jgi:ATP-binding cassette subfamily B protein
MRKHKAAFLGILALFLFRIVVDTIRPLFLKKIIDLIAFNGVDRSLVSVPLYHTIFILFFLYFFAFAFGRISKYLHLRFEFNVIKELRDFAFKKIQGQSNVFFSNMFAGSLVTKSNRFVGSFEKMFDIFIYNFYYTTVTFITIFVVLFIQSKFICLVFSLWVLFFISIVGFFVRKKIKYDLEEAEADSRISGRLADVFGNNIAVKTYSAGSIEYGSFQDLTTEAKAKSEKAWYFANRIDSLQGFLNFIVQCCVLFTLVYFWIAGKISAGTVVLVQSYMGSVFDRLWDLGNSLGQFMKRAADMQEVVDIFEMPVVVQDPAVPEELKMNEGRIVFDSMSFSYNEGREIFANLNLAIEPGEKIGIVGHSGAGKSTITKLLLRFSDVTEGAITIDGQDIRNVTQDDLHSVISYVPQEPLLFHRTIRENIAYGNPDVSIEEVMEAAKRANAHEFIVMLPYGYDTYVGERGVKLSGGERQRVAIARAILKNAPILLLDEATSSLDSHSENLIQGAFDELMKGKTTIVIAHRLSTIQKMDRIIVLENGLIAEEGTHAKLLENPNSLYSAMWNLQAGGFIDDEETE